MYCCKALNFNRGVLHTRNSQCFKARSGGTRMARTSWEDILDGIRGVLGAIKRGRWRLRHLWGVPVLPHAPRPAGRRPRRRSHGSSEDSEGSEDNESRCMSRFLGRQLWGFVLDCTGTAKKIPREKREVSELVLDGVGIGALLSASGQNRLGNECRECRRAAVDHAGQVVSGGERVAAVSGEPESQGACPGGTGEVGSGRCRV